MEANVFIAPSQDTDAKAMISCLTTIIHRKEAFFLPQVKSICYVVLSLSAHLVALASPQSTAAISSPPCIAGVEKEFPSELPYVNKSASVESLFPWEPAKEEQAVHARMQFELIRGRFSRAQVRRVWGIKQ